MARRAQMRLSSRSANKADQEDGELPQSTLAAQLVQQFTDGSKHARPSDQETLQQLLQEVIGTGADPSTSAEDLENNVSMNSKLIYVIAKTGLDYLPPNDPFEKGQRSSPPTKDSLAAIEITIRKCPEVLFVDSQHQDMGSKDRGLLYQWLLPKLFFIMAKAEDVPVQQALTSALGSCLIGEGRSMSNGTRCGSIYAYIKGCVRDALKHLETSVHSSTGCLRLPSLITLEELEDRFMRDPVDQIPCIVIMGRSKAIRIITGLLSVMADSDGAYPRDILTGTTSQPRSRWIVGTLTQIWSSLHLEIAQTSHGNPSLTSLRNIVESLSTCLKTCSRPRFDFSNTARSALLLSQVLASSLLVKAACFLPRLQKSFCLGLLDLASVRQFWKGLGEILDERLLPILLNVKDDTTRLQNFSSDLQRAIHLFVDLEIRRPALDTACLPINQLPDFEDADILQAARVRFLDPKSNRTKIVPARPLKRARFSEERASDEKPDHSSSFISRVFMLLGADPNTKFQDLSKIAADRCSRLSDTEQCMLYNDLGYSACQLADMLATSSNDYRLSTAWRSYRPKCELCDSNGRVNGRLLPQADSVEIRELLMTISEMIKSPKSQRSKQPRIAAMIAIGRVLSHTNNEPCLDLATSTLGHWCLQALQSSLRELRIAAGRALPVFLRNSLEPSSQSKNRIVALDFLRNLSDRGDISLQETCILAWGQIARRINDGDEMNLVLLKLVEYLGHANALLSGLAFDEMQRICNHSPFSAIKVFAPYWRTIAVAVVQDLQRRPQMAQQISDLLAMSVQEFLVLTQAHTVPFFVLTKRQDVLQRIADACGHSIMTLCRDHNNLAGILASILLRSSNDAESLVMSLLNAVSPDFEQVDCAELLKSEPQSTATELLKSAGDEDEIKRSTAHQALQFLAAVTLGRQGSGRGPSRSMDVVGPFFENHVLGIMAILADTINDGKGPQPTLEKFRCLRAIREMITIAKGQVSNGLPQICACLRSAIANKELCNIAFHAWIVMINSLETDDVSPLVDPTFALIVQYWDSFLPNVQHQAQEMVSYILKAHSSMIRDIVHTLPSLAGIPLMSKFEEEMGRFKLQMDVKHHFQAFGQRCQNENSSVVTRALAELAVYLQEHQDWLHETAASEQPDPVVGQLTRSILDTSVLFNESDPGICLLCAKCMGLIGCLDPTKIDAVKEKKEILVLSNFARDEDRQNFIIFFLREVLVKAFLSATNSRSQGFLAYAMQELLRLGDFQSSVGPRSRDVRYDANSLRWHSLPESIRTLLTPFLDSKYFVTAGVPQSRCKYPLFNPNMSHRQWLRAFTYDLLRHESGGGMIHELFSILSRIIRSQDISISEFLLPFAVSNVVLNGTDQEKLDIAKEMMAVLDHPLVEITPVKENLILCSQTIFHVLDYLSRWMQEKKKEISHARSLGSRSRQPADVEIERDTLQISSLEAILGMIPADVISRRAMECKSFSRALFHWEQYMRQEAQKHADIDRPFNPEPLFERLQDIYTQIDEPDGIEGISAHLQVLNIDQQILEHRKAGRWSAAQSWYEILLTERPDDLNIQYNLLTSLKDSGQPNVLLNQVQSFSPSDASRVLSLPFAIEASWVSGKWEKLKDFIAMTRNYDFNDFNVGIGRALVALANSDTQDLSTILDELRRTTVLSLSTTNTSSLQTCHESMLQFHVLAELDAISTVKDSHGPGKSRLMTRLAQRLSILGPFLADKQYILGIRRAAMLLCNGVYTKTDVSSAWLSGAKLARKGNLTHQAFDAVLHASQLGDESATIEHSRLLWRAGSHRKAIQSLEGAIAANAFKSYEHTSVDESVNTGDLLNSKNILKAKAHLLLAKWVDSAGQTQSDAIIHEYKNVIEAHNRWEKGHYYLGKHYNKLLESEKAKAPSKQAQTFITGETAKLVVENYLRSLAFGAKYVHQTLPRILTLWLGLGYETEQPLDPKYGNDENFRSHTMSQRRKLLSACNSQVKKYTDRLPAWVMYTALAQIVARICHPNQAVYNVLVDIVAKVVIQHTPQAMWTLLAMIKSSSKDRASRGVACMTRVLENTRKEKGSVGTDMKTWIAQGQKLSEQLLQVCEGDIQGKSNQISLSRDLGFNHKTAVCKLAVPFESSLTATLPSATESVSIRQHKAFSNNDYIHISSFLDDVLVLNSLQKPRKISIRGSDGRIYAMLCKPKDDLRKDQRLMEFNAMINRSLKKDAEASKRRLYIKTYAVTPLNETCGLIEWVDNLKTLREILLATYRQKNIHINYQEIRQLLNESVSAPNKLPIFTDKVLVRFPPVFHEWFVEMFPEPGAWLAARLRYTRSCAVMSIVGHVLGLGDRHGENILFEESNGGTLHVDFNCLFDKGLTFEKPELVPFRLTHNMVDAFGAQGYEGAFRKSCELTLGVSRGNEDTLMTILETFLYDPTTDFIGKKKKVNAIVPDTPEGVLESVRNKVHGLIVGESVPLSVEGYVDELIKQARDPWKLASMYIGWCAFF